MPRDRDILAFDQRASRYDDGWLGEFHHQIAERAVDLAANNRVAPRHVLDVGSGTGYLLRRLAVRLPEAEIFVGIDPAHQMVRHSRERMTDPRICVTLGSAEHLPFSDSVFDLVISTTSFDHWKDQQAGLRECARVLVTGGQLLLTDQFSNWLLPTLLTGRKTKARTQRRASVMISNAGFHSLVWHNRYAAIMRTVTASA